MCLKKLQTLGQVYALIQFYEFIYPLGDLQDTLPQITQCSKLFLKDSPLSQVGWSFSRGAGSVYI